MGLIELLENTGVAIWVRESPSIFAYIFILSLHAMGLAIVAGLSAVVALRILGIARGVPLPPMAMLFPLMYFGFTLNAISGILLFMANASGMLSNFMFYIKMAFVAVAFVLMVLLQRRFRDATAHNARGLAFGMMICWLGAIVAGRLVSYPYFVATWLGL